MLDLTDTETSSVPTRPGVVASALYRDGRRVQEIAVEEIGAFAGGEGGIVWLGLHEPEEALLGTIQSQLALHELMIEDANQAHQRAKLDIYDSVLFIVLRTAQLGMRELEWSFGYPASLLLMLAICRTLYYRFRRAAWL
jgi:magnesium transporter